WLPLVVVMPRHPPRPTLFPYTTLFRSCALRPGAVERLLEAFQDEAVAVAFGRVDAPEADGGFIPTYAPARRRVLRERAGKLRDGDRKSTRLNSSHVKISYAVFCLKKKT